jgi:hypothetical protein
MAKGPLAVRWLDWTLDQPHAGAVSIARVGLENAGTISWRNGICLGYHWLDERGNPLIWDGVRTEIPHLAPGEHATIDARVRAPIPPGRYGLALDLVAELRAWFSELDGDQLQTTVDVLPRVDPTHAEIPVWIERGESWQRRVGETHAEGYAVVAGAVSWNGSLLHHRPRALEPYRPGRGRVPGFSHPLVCPSVVNGVQLERLPDIAGLPAYAPPADEPWIYDGRIVLMARPSKR